MKIDTTLIAAMLLTACAAKSDSAPPVEPEPESTAQPVEASTPEAEAEPEAAVEDKAKPEPAAATGDVLAVVTARPNTKVFVELLEKADLAKTLHSTDGAGFTLLVPTDDAFAALPKGALDKLKKNTAELERVLKYHIVPGTHDVGKLGNFRTAPTALGKEIEVKVQDSDVIVHGGKLIETDFKASNGYVHIVDKVLLPKK